MERKALNAITQEITNMDSHMPELKGIKTIFDEFTPAYKVAVVEKAQLFVQEVGIQVKKTVTDKVPMPMSLHIE